MYINEYNFRCVLQDLQAAYDGFQPEGDSLLFAEGLHHVAYPACEEQDNRVSEVPSIYRNEAIILTFSSTWDAHAARRATSGYITQILPCQTRHD
jgi:hypothetical protein